MDQAESPSKRPGPFSQIHGDSGPKATLSDLKSKCLSTKFLMIAGIIACSILILEGFMCFSICKSNIRSYVLSFYYILFGLMTIFAELKFQFMMKRISNIFHRTGRGIWYLFLGTLSLGGEWWSIISTICLVLLSGLNLCAEFHNEESEDVDARWGISSVDSRGSGDLWQNPAAEVKEEINPIVELTKNKAIKTNATDRVNVMQDVVPAIPKQYQDY